MDKLLSVIIVNYNKIDELCNCLNSIEKYNDIGNKLEIIVVLQLIKKEDFSYLKKTYGTVKFIEVENRGFGAGNNVGARISCGKYLEFLNPDTILTEPIFAAVISRFERKNSLGLIGIQMLDIAKKRRISYNFNRLPLSILFYFIKITKLLNMCNCFCSSLMYIEGANLCIRRSVFLQCGLFDEKIFLYSEEADLCKRIKEMGYKVKYDKNLSYIHIGGTQTNHEEIKQTRVLESYRYLCGKWGIDFVKEIKYIIHIYKIALLTGKIINKNKGVNLKKQLKIYEDFLQNEYTAYNKNRGK